MLVVGGRPFSTAAMMRLPTSPSWLQKSRGENCPHISDQTIGVGMQGDRIAFATLTCGMGGVPGEGVGCATALPFAREHCRAANWCTFASLTRVGLPLEARASVGVPRDQFPADSPIAENTVIQDGLGVVERLGTDILNEDFAQRIAGRWKWFIEEITPLVDTWHAEVQNSEDDEALEDDDYEDEEEIGGTQ